MLGSILSKIDRTVRKGLIWGDYYFMEALMKSDVILQRSE